MNTPTNILEPLKVEKEYDFLIVLSDSFLELILNYIEGEKFLELSR